MLDLMAEATGGQLLVLYLEKIAVPILRPDTHRIGAGDDAELAGDAEAALQTCLLPLGGDDLRVHQFNDILVLVHHHAHTAQHAHLRGGQTHAAGIQQCLLHVVDQRVQALIELRHRAAHLGQALVALQYDLSQSHILRTSNPSDCSPCGPPYCDAPGGGRRPSYRPPAADGAVFRFGPPP